MTVDPPWVRGELVWLRSGPLYRVHRDALPSLSEFLDRHRYRRLELDGTRMTSREAAHDELAAAFGFPDYYGHNWDAFTDCLGDFVAAHDGELVAVVWHDIEAAAGAAAATSAEVAWALLDGAFRHQPRLDADGQPSLWVHVFAIGASDDFDRPSVGGNGSRGAD